MIRNKLKLLLFSFIISLSCCSQNKQEECPKIIFPDSIGISNISDNYLKVGKTRFFIQLPSNFKLVSKDSIFYKTPYPCKITKIDSNYLEVSTLNGRSKSIIQKQQFSADFYSNSKRDSFFIFSDYEIFFLKTFCGAYFSTDTDTTKYCGQQLMWTLSFNEDIKQDKLSYQEQINDIADLVKKNRSENKIYTEDTIFNNKIINFGEYKGMFSDVIVNSNKLLGLSFADSNFIAGVNCEFNHFNVIECIEKQYVYKYFANLSYNSRLPLSIKELDIFSIDLTIGNYIFKSVINDQIFSEPTKHLLYISNKNKRIDIFPNIPIQSILIFDYDAYKLMSNEKRTRIQSEISNNIFNDLFQNESNFENQIEIINESNAVRYKHHEFVKISKLLKYGITQGYVFYGILFDNVNDNILVFLSNLETENETEIQQKIFNSIKFK
jgi:hypothetical protein